MPEKISRQIEKMFNDKNRRNAYEAIMLLANRIDELEGKIETLKNRRSPAKGRRGGGGSPDS